MIACRKCGRKNKETETHCQDCGEPLKPQERSNTMASLAKDLAWFAHSFERSVFFRVARGFAWIVCLVATLVLLGTLYRFIQLTPTMIGGNTKVNHDEVTDAIAAMKTPNRFGGSAASDGPTERIDPDLLSRLDKKIYEIIVLLPKNYQTDDGREKARTRIRKLLDNFDDYKEKVVVADEARFLVESFAIEDRADALLKYFELKISKIANLRMKKALILQEFYITLGIIVSAIFTITLVSLVLVMLSIERNTRRV